MNETHEKPVGVSLSVSQCIIAYSTSFVENIGKLWYLIDPHESTFEFAYQVPDYQQQIWLPFFMLIVLETVILYAKNHNSFRLNDHVTSLSHWIFQESGRILFRGTEYYTYIFLYENYRLWNLPWDSPWMWYATAIGVDFCYYWVHRANHEVHFLWAHHQVHHSSEEFNLVVGLRQSVLQHWCSFAFYLPLALFVPPSLYVAHHQFNLIYQLWIHTTVIEHLGPLEWIFNTPKHHRVHHGCNLYCLDKNYGGVLIIWDRIFGTFMEQRPQDDIIYGLVVSPQTFNPLYLQIFYAKEMIRKSLSMSSVSDKLSVIWKGPSWFPGAPRLGLDEFKVNVTSRFKYDTYLPRWQKIYIILHYSIVFYMHFHLYDEKQDFLSTILLVLNNVLTVTTIGLLFDKYDFANIVELMRCGIHLGFLTTERDGTSPLANQLIYYVYFGSWCMWILYFGAVFKPDRIEDI